MRNNVCDQVLSYPGTNSGWSNRSPTPPFIWRITRSLICYKAVPSGARIMGKMASSAYSYLESHHFNFCILLTDLMYRISRPEFMTPEVWDYIFVKNSPYPKNCKLPKKLLEAMRREFQYWYPVDLRVSGKDLIQNHLTFFIYNHCAIWPNEEDKWPKGIRANGHLMLNSAKVLNNFGCHLPYIYAPRITSARDCNRASDCRCPSPKETSWLYAKLCRSSAPTECDCA